MHNWSERLGLDLPYPKGSLFQWRILCEGNILCCALLQLSKQVRIQRHKLDLSVIPGNLDCPSIGHLSTFKYCCEFIFPPNIKVVMVNEPRVLATFLLVDSSPFFPPNF
jgi:hypothetical protein